MPDHDEDDAGKETVKVKPQVSFCFTAGSSCSGPLRPVLMLPVITGMQ